MNTTQKTLEMKTPEKSNIKFPTGCVLVNPKWRNEVLGRDLSRKTHVTYSDVLGLVDFYVSEEHPVLFMSELDMLNKMKECREKLSKLHSMYKGKGTVILERNSKIISQYNDLQEYAVLDFGMFVIPVSCSSEIPAVLQKMVQCELKSPVRVREKVSSAPKLCDQISVLNKIPGINTEKAKLLLERFGNLYSISEATKDTLESTIGNKVGRKVFDFFNNTGEQ